MPAFMNSGASFLSRLPLFADVSAETLARLEHRMRRREFAPRAVIVREGSTDDSAFLVLSGRVAVRRNDPDSGIEFLLAELGEGEMFGEMALLTRKPRTASVVALEATTCGIIEQSDFDQLLVEHPTGVRAMMAALADRLDAVNRHVGIDFVSLSRLKIDEPAVMTDDDFKRFMSSSYPQLVAEEDGQAVARRQGIPRPAGSTAPPKPAAPPAVDLLESDLIRELQLAADTEDQKVETKQDLMSASEDAPIIIGLNFASVLRAFLRPDPDVLLVGETRDKETAKTAVEAALTGHLVFTTLHTNSAAVAFTRLHEMDVEPFLVSSSTIGVIAQRLARRLCQECKEPTVVDANVARFWGLAEGSTIFRGKGCSACGGKGVRGRVGVYEVMKVTPRIRTMVGSGARSKDIHAAALEEGMIDLKRYSAWLITEGLTSVEEVTSVVSVDI